jgi:hypothetical protein
MAVTASTFSGTRSESEAGPTVVHWDLRIEVARGRWLISLFS